MTQTPADPQATLIDGKAMAARVRAQVARDVATLKDRHGLTPGLHVVIVGDNPASQIYVRNKVAQATEAGLASVKHELPTDTPEADLLALVARLNADPAVHGILVQLPLPPQIDEQAVIAAIAPEKDVDGFHVLNAGKLATGGDGLVPCTPLGCLIMLRDRLGDLSGLDALVIGRSNIVGKPMAQLLLREHCTVTVAHSRSRDLADLCRRADILVAAVGRAHLVQGDWIKPGATVIDVGMNRIPAPEKGAGKTRLAGDVDFAAARAVAGAITPVPGGVGPMTIACLLKNTVTAACRQAGVPVPSPDRSGDA
ncbi:bifunctional methylenetetrahydrofolate dehydrogenase/methenyltetrahydrofolate cyclohydrolase [Rhodothalassium salexigens]|uniref:bifunctional methylenetetrahydrofolate dehydrogenase/methenyltetrahydrofolate cyclohydrolase n=1 Tax=Rhodothalassium salexigens TaxID=1086 RepID=UPI001911FE4D|nr:bifunctional methylenetetrahydrofolate dehydrogenase/methenyltetrahydrofolate cyclohydrolase [Rhodothalassium salexigens]MBK5921414.1 bifunctional methylenetetrahydrofolate dehydrogenase/methenyltetrahydrofolate cyclohydrolase [Rhodothalassium salexigens]